MNEKVPKEIQFHYKKTDSYRAYHCDGAYGGITPTGKIYMEVFVERNPTPTSITAKVLPDGAIGPEVKREGKTGIIRQVECGLVLDIQTAKSLRDWLNDKIEKFEQITKTKKVVN